jgi:hypothetical protein
MLKEICVMIGIIAIIIGFFGIEYPPDILLKAIGI